MQSGSRANACRGFSYLLLMVVMAVLAVTAGAVSAGQNVFRRQSEQGLLGAGEELRAALISYRSVGGGGVRSGPKELVDLLRDPREPGVRRHLRRVPIDPLTGMATWGVVRDALGDIAAVYSLAEGQPIKREGFEPVQVGFDNADSYAQWLFGVGLVAR